MREKQSVDHSRRRFLQMVGAATPYLKLMSKNDRNTSAGARRPAEMNGKFTPIYLDSHFNCSPIDFGYRERARNAAPQMATDGLLRMHAGQKTAQGIPFRLAPEGLDEKSWLVLSRKKAHWIMDHAEIPLRGTAYFVGLAQFCDWDPNETPPSSRDVSEQVGQLLADATVVYEDGSEQVFPLRRRFEVNSPTDLFGHFCFGALHWSSAGPMRLFHATEYSSLGPKRP